MHSVLRSTHAQPHQTSAQGALKHHWIGMETETGEQQPNGGVTLQAGEQEQIDCAQEGVAELGLAGVAFVAVQGGARARKALRATAQTFPAHRPQSLM